MCGPSYEKSYVQFAQVFALERPYLYRPKAVVAHLGINMRHLYPTFSGGDAFQSNQYVNNKCFNFYHLAMAFVAVSPPTDVRFERLLIATARLDVFVMGLS